MERVFIFDTTLRDGEQSPGASMSMEQKIEIAHQLGRLGVDVIEAGFPISSPHQFSACSRIAKEVKGPVITALARTTPADIEAAADSLQDAERKRIHVFVATSPLHMKYKLEKDPASVLEMAIQGVTHARKYTDDIEFSPEDGTRSELDFLCRVVEKVIDAGARVINIPDTVGYAVPEEFGAFISSIMNRVPNIDKAIISVHCHNDLGLAVANSLQAIKNGARQVEVTVNGIGERAGNASLEELIMALYVRKDVLPFETGIDTKQLYKTSRIVSNLIGFPIPRNKPVVGENAFAHESGIHQHGVLKNRETYEIMTPESVGRDSSVIVLGRHSGMHGFKTRLSEIGLILAEEDIKTSYQRFLEIADRKKEVFDDDLFAIVSEVLGQQAATYVLDYFNIISGNVSLPTATVRIVSNGDSIEEAATGDGPVDAIFRAIDRAVNLSPTLKEYSVQAVTPGKQALGEVAVVLDFGTCKCTGRGSSTDILEASARAYVNALNRYKLLDREGCNGKMAAAII